MYRNGFGRVWRWRIKMTIGELRTMLEYHDSDEEMYITVNDPRTDTPIQYRIAGLRYPCAPFMDWSLECGGAVLTNQIS